MRRILLALAVLAVALATHAAAGLFTILETCAVSDVATTVPAPASTQGRVCLAEDHWLNVVPWLVLGLGVVLAVVLAVRLAPTRWRWVGLTACLWLPLVAVGVLAVPADACTPEQGASLPAYACTRTGNG